MRETTNIQLKRMNRNRIYRTILARQETSIQELAYGLQLSVPTVTQNLHELMEQGLIAENGTFASTGGRKAKVIASVPKAKIAIGIDITKNHITYVALNLERTVLQLRRIKMAFAYTDEYLEKLNIGLEDMILRIGCARESILGCGIALPAIIASDEQTLQYAPILDWPEHLYEKIKEKIEIPMYFVNDANAGAVAELAFGNAGKDFIYISLSNSVGGAIVTNGRLNSGQNYKSGEFGHMTLEENGLSCYCGKKGCMDAYCSALVLTESTGETLEQFFEQLANKEKEHEVIWAEYLRYLAIAVNNLQLIFDCDIVLGGYIGRYLEPYLPELKDKVAKRSSFPIKRDFLKVSSLRTEAAALGAAVPYIEAFLEQI